MSELMIFKAIPKQTTNQTTDVLSEADVQWFTNDYIVS